MTTEQAVDQLREQGVALLSGFFEPESLIRLREAAAQCFQAIETASVLPGHYRFSRTSNSLALNALKDFGCDGGQLTAPLAAPGLAQLISDAMGWEWSCNMEQSWVRKKFAPYRAPASGYHAQDWHQDGALGVRFPLQAGPVTPMTELMTCWIPLNPCGIDSPGLEFVRCRQPALLHFSELDDSLIRKRFAEREFWAPVVEFGDGLVFLNDVLHRTCLREAMQHDRLSVEYRVFPRAPVHC